MDTATQILVIIVSTTLTVFLILLIVALFYLIKVLKHVKYVINRAEQVADSVEIAAEYFKNSTPPIAVIKLIGSIIKKAAKNRQRR